MNFLFHALVLILSHLSTSENTKYRFYKFKIIHTKYFNQIGVISYSITKWASPRFQMFHVKHFYYKGNFFGFPA